MGKKLNFYDFISLLCFDRSTWSPDGKQLIVSRVSDGSLMSLDIARLLKQKGVTP